ncbi:MAG: AlbA family DNA-binding domain-containing protein [Terriglobia bacterium]
MNNASLIYESLNNYSAIVALIGKQEDIFLDFKESRSTNGALLDDDKAHFSKAASGFAHQEGGVLVWGIEARKGSNEIDEAKALKPIANIKKFLAGLNDYIKYSTEPVVDGIQNRIIFENDDQKTNKGYAITFFAKSDAEHRALGNNRSDFYKRHGDSFSPLSTADIRALFFRSFSPDLELRVKGGPGEQPHRFSLYNRGRGVAKFPSMQIGFDRPVRGLWEVGDGNPKVEIGAIVRVLQGKYALQFIANASLVVHPDQEIYLLAGPYSDGVTETVISNIFFRIFAENMPPKEGCLVWDKDRWRVQIPS